MEILRTNLAMTVKCKCGSLIASTMLYGGISIDEDFMSLVAETVNDGGVISIVDTSINPVTMSLCKCK